jgi:peroxiredoxin
MRLILSVFFCIAFTLSVFAQQKEIGTKPAAPAFNITSIDGKTFDSEKLKGKIVVLNLWYINCPNCVEEIKLLNKVVDEYAGKDVVFIGMATNDKAKLEGFLKKNPFKYNIVPKAMQTILSFGEPDKSGNIEIPFPMHVVIDRDGKITVRRSGIKGLDAMKAELKKQFETAPKKSD